MQNIIGTRFESKGKTFEVTTVTPVDANHARTIEKLEASGKSAFYFGAGAVLNSGEVSEKQTGIFLRFNSGKFMSYM